MKIVSAESMIMNVSKYLKSDINNPFIIVVDNSREYINILDELDTLVKVHVSDFCINDDSFPDTDALCDYLSVATQNMLILGLGESISLSGNIKTLGRIKDLPLKSKAVVICRGIQEVVRGFCQDDKKFYSRRVCYIESGDTYNIVKVTSNLKLSVANGFKELLIRLENGASGMLCVKTNLQLNNVCEAISAYETLKCMEPTFIIPQTCFPDNLWAEFLSNNNLEGFEFIHWRSFLKFKLETSSNVYIRYAVDISFEYDDYKRNIFSALLDFDKDDENFTEMYNARKALLKKVEDGYISEYITETIDKKNDRIFYLTDNTLEERQAIIECLNGVDIIPKKLSDIYPSLYEYLYEFSFSGEKSQLLTKYFTEYKRLKITNRLTPQFLAQVSDFATDGNRPYNSLKTRGEVLDNLIDDNTGLYWVDALGAEYLGYIQSRSNVMGLKITVHAVRANLPTITSFNSDFYDAWEGIKGQTKDLDKIKHEGEKDYNYQTVKTPIHLAEELRIIDSALDWVKSKLVGKKVNKVLLVSDHGASRLAVINRSECKWEMKSQGKHSGRCCPRNDVDVKSEYATEENGFWVLANYDRFKGGRKASVEVHGGATLEEVVIPLIEFSLVNNQIIIRNDTPITLASYKRNAEIVLFSTSSLKQVYVKVLGQRYIAEAIDNNKHKVVFPDLKRADKYIAGVFEGDNLIGQVKFEIQREIAKTNDADWF